MNKRLTVNHGGLYTSEISILLGKPQGKVWRILRELEIDGVLVGEARDRNGDEVERGIDGKPKRAGVEIRWFVNSADDRPSPESERAARLIRERLS